MATWTARTSGCKRGPLSFSTRDLVLKRSKNYRLWTFRFRVRLSPLGCGAADWPLIFDDFLDRCASSDTESDENIEGTSSTSMWHHQSSPLQQMELNQCGKLSLGTVKIRQEVPPSRPSLSSPSPHCSSTHSSTPLLVASCVPVHITAHMRSRFLFANGRGKSVLPKNSQDLIEMWRCYGYVTEGSDGRKLSCQRQRGGYLIMSVRLPRYCSWIVLHKIMIIILE